MFRIGIHHGETLAKRAEDVADAVRDRFPEIEIMPTKFAGGPAGAEAKDVQLVLHDAMQPTPEMVASIARVTVPHDAPSLVIPISSGLQRCNPPDGLQYLKGAHWPDDASMVLDRIGVWLGLMLLPGAQKIFISYKTSDGEAAAIALEKHLQARGYRVFRDASKDRDDGTPNISPGDNLHDVLAKHIRGASAVLLLDTPAAPQSIWIHGETKITIGRRIPILPVVFRAQGDDEGSRFRRLKELHRFVPVPLAAGAAPVLDEAACEIVVVKLERFLLTITQRRRACLESVKREFANGEWSFDGYRDFQHLFEAQRRQLKPGQRTAWFFSCCSLEDDVRTASVIQFVREIKEAGANRSYARHIYFHLGDPLFGDDLDYLQREAIPAVEDRNIDFCHYQEAALKLNPWLAAH